LENQDQMNMIKTQARNTILAKYDLKLLLSRQINLLQTVATKGVW
jgi:hypothetical protein